MMRTFVIRARKGSTHWNQIKSAVGTEDHIEVVAHTVMNAFFTSNGFRQDVEVYVVLDSSDDFPRTIKLSGADGLSIAGFHEMAVLDLIERALKESAGLQKNETRLISAGLQISGFGFEKLITQLLETRPVHLLDRKGEDARDVEFAVNPVFILSDHLAMPANIVKSFTRRGVKMLSLGKKMLFASQCVVLINHELDRNGF